MRIKLRVVPNAKKVEVKEEKDFFKIKLKSKPEGGKANKELIEVLSKYFKIPKSKVKIVSGLTSHKKIVEIEKD